MTQVNRAQQSRALFAWNPERKGRTLAQRRADLEAQMRAMALSDLQAVARRLGELHERLNYKHGRRWTQQEIAEKVGVPYRTYQSWAEGHVENRDGGGYDKIAKFYRRELDDPTITRRWIVFGDEEPEAKPREQGREPSQLDRMEETLNRIDRLLSGAPDPTVPTAAGELRPPETPAPPKSPGRGERESKRAGSARKR